MKVSSFIREIRYLIHDLPATGYPDALLLEFINDGLCFIYEFQPERFTVSRLVPAVNGEVQCLDLCCDRLISVDALTDACGNPKAQLRQGSVKAARAFDKAAQAGKGGYVYSIRDNVAEGFEIYPAIRSDDGLYFRITCTEAPTPAQNADDTLPDCRHHEALLQYVLYRVYAVESDSGESQTLAQNCYMRALQLLGAQRSLGLEISEDNQHAKIS